MAQFVAETSKAGAFVRQPNHFTDRVTADGSSGYPVESGCYRLFVSLACPWAHRAIIVRRLLGLDEHISLGIVDPIRDEKGWRFTLDEGGRRDRSGDWRGLPFRALLGIRPVVQWPLDRTHLLRHQNSADRHQRLPADHA